MNSKCGFCGYEFNKDYESNCPRCKEEFLRKKMRNVVDVMSMSQLKALDEKLFG